VGALEEVRDLAAAVTDRRSLRLWDVQVAGQPGRAVVRVYVDKEGGVDLDTMAEVSEEISRGLDLRDPIPGKYALEVSSPGLERTLSVPEHFKACTGRRVVVKTKEKLVPEGHRLEGVIVHATDSSTSVDVDGEIVQIPYASIKKARTVFVWS